MSSTPPHKRTFSRADFLRYSRLIHGWLSALAFLVLILFSFTGLLLNHPEWLAAAAPEPIISNASLTAEEIEELDWANNPGRELADIAHSKLALKGEYIGGNKVGAEIFARLQGVKGLTDLRANLNTGTLEAVVEPAPLLSVLNELHRAERAGEYWRVAVDIIAVLLIVLSVVGYVIFLALRLRRTTALLLTAGSTIGLFALYYLTVF